ncbi:hypothetical protein Tsp_09871 [Trichinella spiralis]|uniref:hypothetical protein n=1 Tax=Trichinella spiralis TaxID=6334 RepID=UPI0001EFDC12|nr:hypothetical protein Tsp_09871 [Trichinella spiralis]
MAAVPQSLLSFRKILIANNSTTNNHKNLRLYRNLSSAHQGTPSTQNSVFSSKSGISFLHSALSTNIVRSKEIRFSWHALEEEFTHTSPHNLCLTGQHPLLVQAWHASLPNNRYILGCQLRPSQPKKPLPQAKYYIRHWKQ